MIVTAVERKPRRRRVHVFVDGRFALALGRELAAEHDVRPGRTLTSAELSALAEEEARRGAMESALRLLSYRPRSEQELRDRLTRKGFEPAVADRTLDRLRELGYLDDDAFARLWTETQQAFRPKSRWLLTAELRRRGVSQHTAEEATAGLSDEEAAYQAAQRRLRALHSLEYQRFREKLGGFLNRRGFSYEIARQTVDRCWAERGEAPDEDEDSK
ncbi:MAG: RecX family transcriptional regulator [Chloroflexi bacterium]|nr:RecX family transcriptional regulator [Chloroflexota bacterium]